MISPRVQSRLGEKVVAPVPEVMPSSTAHSTASRYQALAGISEKPATSSTSFWIGPNCPAKEPADRPQGMGSQT